MESSYRNIACTDSQGKYRPYLSKLEHAQLTSSSPVKQYALFLNRRDRSIIPGEIYRLIKKSFRPSRVWNQFEDPYLLLASSDVDLPFDDDFIRKEMNTNKNLLDLKTVYAVTKEIIYSKHFVALVFEDFSVPFGQFNPPHMIIAKFVGSKTQTIEQAINDPYTKRIPFSRVIPLEFDYIEN